MNTLSLVADHLPPLLDGDSFDELVRCRMLIENLEQCVFLKDIESHFVAVNRRFCEALGRSEAEVLGKTDFDFYPPELAAQHVADDRRVLAGQRLEQEERMLVGGETRLVHVVKTPLHDGERVAGVLGIFWDVTAQHTLEQQLRQTQKMEAVGQLAGGVAHDFNNLLTVILGNLALIQASLPNGHAASGLAGAAEKAAWRAANLTAQLLDFSRRTVLRTEAVLLGDTLEEVAGLLRSILDPRIRLERRSAADLRPVLADPGHLAQAVMHLCLNARDAMPDGGVLSLAADNVRLRQDELGRPDVRAGAYVRLRVEDSGCGIPERLRSRIFEPFFTTKEPGKGTGLGLALVFGIVQQHGGWIESRSEVGRGTCFDIFLPGHAAEPAKSAAPERPGAAPPPIQRPPEARRARILMAEDEASLRELAQRILTLAGFEVFLAVDGLDAVEAYRRHPGIDLVVLDLTMPRLSGRDACRRLRELDAGVRVLFASGYSAEAIPEDEQALSCGFVAKPYRPDSLVGAVRAALERPRAAVV
jgi:PAS domain S-box-containing protein